MVIIMVVIRITIMVQIGVLIILLVIVIFLIIVVIMTIAHILILRIKIRAIIQVGLSTQTAVCLADASIEKRKHLGMTIIIQGRGKIARPHNRSPH